MAIHQETKKGNFLDHLTKGLYDAVVQAQALAENQHIEALSNYINEDDIVRFEDRYGRIGSSRNKQDLPTQL